MAKIIFASSKYQCKRYYPNRSYTYGRKRLLLGTDYQMKNNENYIDCRNCGEEFNANDPFHRSRGYYNQCYDCALKHNQQDDKVKAIVERNEIGDFIGIQIVSQKLFEKYQEAENETNRIFGGGVESNEASS